MDSSLINLIKFVITLITSILGLVIASSIVASKFAKAKYGENENETKPVCKAMIKGIDDKGTILVEVINKKLDSIIADNKENNSSILVKLSEYGKVLTQTQTDSKLSKEKSNNLKSQIVADLIRRKDYEKKQEKLREKNESRQEKRFEDGERRAKEHSGRIREIEKRLGGEMKEKNN